MRTALFERHVQLGAKIVGFAGWEMPLQYSALLQEVKQVRENAGLFDVSHMGRVLISGPDSEKFLDFISANRISGKKDKSATYTVWCDSNGNSIDDLIVYRIDAEHFFIICNAANRTKDHAHLIEQSKNFDVIIEKCFEKEGILALQGPKSLSFLEKIIPEVTDLKPMKFIQKGSLIVAGTGYTGAGGCEIYGPNDEIIELWDALIDLGVSPIGLGARDVLRLEMGYALYGHELSDTIAPTESIAAWSVKLDKPHFLGKEALLTRNNRFQWGLTLEEKGVAREGYEVHYQEKKIGTITSGTYSPTLEKSIAIVLADESLLPGTEVTVLIRGKPILAKVSHFPFI